MVFAALIALFLGIVCGQWLFPAGLSEALTGCSEWVLYLLMFLVGISVGRSKQAFSRLKQYRLKALILPLAVIAASLLAGGLGAVLLGLPPKDGLLIAAGLGWYSLSGAMLTTLSGASLGAAAFIANLLREILSFVLIPFLVRFLSPYAAIGAAGATSEDTTLPMLMRCAGEDVVVLSVLNGAICSAMVPILIRGIAALPL